MRVLEIAHLHTVQFHRVVLPLHLDLEVVPSPRRIRGDFVPHLQRLVVDRAGASDRRRPGCVDLHLEAEMHADPRGIDVALAVGIGESHEDA